MKSVSDYATVCPEIPQTSDKEEVSGIELSISSGL